MLKAYANNPAGWDWSEKQKRMFWASVTQAKWSHAQVKELIKLKWGLDSTKQMDGGQVEFVLDWVRDHAPGHLPVPRDPNTLDLFQ